MSPPSLLSFLSLLTVTLLLFLSSISFTHAAITRPFKCAVCIAFINEMNHSMINTKEQHLVQTRWRVDDKRHIPYYRTEYRLMEIIETELDDRMSAYGESVYQKPVEYKDPDGQPYYINETMVQLVRHETSLTHEIFNYTHNAAVSRRVKKVYRRWIDEMEEKIVMVFHREEDMTIVRDRVCKDVVKACTTIPEHPPHEKKPEPVPETPETPVSATTTDSAPVPTPDTNTDTPATPTPTPTPTPPTAVPTETPVHTEL